MLLMTLLRYVGTLGRLVNMGWKSTVSISINEAKRLILERVDFLDSLTNEELSDILNSWLWG